MRRPEGGRRRTLLAVPAALAVIVPLAVLWGSSLVPSTYSVMDMGVVETGGAGSGPARHGHAHGAGGVSVADLTGPTGRPAVSVTMVARRETVTLADGRSLPGYTLDHRSPGPTIRVVAGELLEVVLVNESVRGGTTLHWHGVDLPNGEDGVAGVTQDAVPVGGRHVYRFVVDEPGTYWYHSHQLSHEQVRDGLWGVLVVEPPRGLGDELEVLAPVHTYDGRATVGGRSGNRRVAAAPGERVRVRVVNTDAGPLDVAVSGAPYRVLAFDARDVVGPGEVVDQAVQVPAGGRADLGVVVPDDGTAVLVRLGLDGRNSLVIGPEEAPVPRPAPVTGDLDPLSYGTPASPTFDPTRPDRDFEYSIGRRPGFVDGRPGLWWTINGHLYPDVPMFVVVTGDVVRMTVDNHSGELHPMHLHGHHALVLSRNGVPASGSPWWVDSLDVADGDTYEIAFLADNPGVWMDHCHNLPHAGQGLVAHVAYEGVSSPYLIGGEHGNEPE